MIVSEFTTEHQRYAFISLVTNRSRIFIPWSKGSKSIIEDRGKSTTELSTEHLYFLCNQRNRSHISFRSHRSVKASKRGGKGVQRCTRLYFPSDQLNRSCIFFPWSQRCFQRSFSGTVYFPSDQRNRSCVFISWSQGSNEKMVKVTTKLLTRLIYFPCNQRNRSCIFIPWHRAVKASVWCTH